MDVNMKMTLKSIDGNVVTLDMEGTVATPEGYETEINGTKVKTALKGTQKGPVKINKDTGWIISSAVDQSLSGDMEIMGMKVPINSTSKTIITSE
jgi:hypothetical protein